METSVKNQNGGGGSLDNRFRNNNINPLKADGTYKRSIITAKTPKGITGLLGRKRRKIEEEESHSSSDSADELEFDDRVGKDELFEILKRSEKEADESSEEEVEITDDEVDEDQENEELVEAENTWDLHLNEQLTAKQIESISDKKSYETSKVSLSVYKQTIIKTPQNVDLPELRSFEEPSELHIRDRIRRNIRKMDEREKNLFSLFHQYKGVFAKANPRIK